MSVANCGYRFQLVEFGGRYFVDTALTFGGSISPTIYKMVARLLIELAALDSGMDLRHSVQHLDDNCVVAAAGRRVMWKYRKRLGSGIGGQTSHGR